MVGLLAEPERLRVVAAVVLGARTREQIAEATGLDSRTIATALTRLIAGGLVVHDPEGYSVDMDGLRAGARVAAHRRTEVERSGTPEDEILSRFVKGGRLVSMPSTRSKRAAVLDYLAQSFEPGRYYEEREVNRLLERYHDDYATLRRYLVDESFLSREGGKYWRSGGTVAP